jgi:hypothetical protein
MNMRAILLILCLCQTGCAAYSVVSAGTYIATGKSLTDHGVSTVTQADCNGVKHITSGQYYCEVAPVYNRSAF